MYILEHVAYLITDTGLTTKDGVEIVVSLTQVKVKAHVHVQCIVEC